MLANKIMEYNKMLNKNPVKTVSPDYSLVNPQKFNS